MMQPERDVPEPIASAAMTKVAADVVQKASAPILRRIASRLSLGMDRLKVQFIKCFQDELARAYERSETVKTIISRDQPVLLEEIYVPLTLKSGDECGLSDLEADPSTKPGLRFILSGTGGAGKTFLMKHLLNCSRDNRHGFIPLFIELRNLQWDTGDSLEDCIHAELVSRGSYEDRQLFQVALEEGIFVVYLDGFDEVHPHEKPNALQLIRRFSDRYSATSMLVTTRPLAGVETLQSFTIFHVEPLSKGQAIDLIEKTEFDHVTKSKFLTDMQDGLYDRHQTLMSLPILLGMMLLTYRTYADIPDRMTVFYSQAFETLYSIHDSQNKELFKRKHNAGLSPDTFKRVLQAFCYLSLSNHDIEFSDTSLDGYIKRALSISQVDVNELDFKSDLINNVCVLQPEGLSYIFVHRSFQEYFAALFALNFSGANPFRVIERVALVSGSAVAEMMAEIDRVKLERNWVLPKLDELVEWVRVLRTKSLTKQIGDLFSPAFVRDGKTSYGLSEYNSLFLASEILATIVDPKVSLLRLLDDVKIPTEERLKEGGVNQAPINEASRNFKIVYDSSRVYEITRSSDWVIRESGFQDGLRAYVENLRGVRSELAATLSSYAALEDAEIFG